MASSKPKLLHLQGLRGVAILAVIAFHFFPEHCRNGYLGVDMFFLLSGFLMTMMLDRVKTVSTTKLIDFWYRRFKRILPYDYLAIFGIMVLLFALDGIIRSENVDPALHATILATNLIRPSGDAGYFEKLGVAVDMFTHTWSLALEMQFYLMFPFIFIFIKYLPCQAKPSATLFIGFVSLLFHMYSDEFTSFNSVFSRIWQFMAGMVAFYADQIKLGTSKTSNNDKEKAPISDHTDSSHPTNTVLSNIFVFALLAMFLIPQEVFPLYARINTIIISFAIVAYGKNCCLKNSALVFIGEISYGWYLVHWPVYALLKINKSTDPMHLMGGVLFSFILAVILHYTFEKHYLLWSNVVIFSTVFCLLMANGAAVIWMKTLVETRDEELPVTNNAVFYGVPKDLDKRFFFPSDFSENIVYGFENKTAEERIALNLQYNSGDRQRTHGYCKNQIQTENLREFRCEMNEMANKTANTKLLILGNSYAANIMKPLAESCSHRFSHLEIVSQSGCESMFPERGTGHEACESSDHMYVDGIKRVNPDVLVLFTRFGNPARDNGTSLFTANSFKLAVEQFKEYEKYTKKHILIFDVFPLPRSNIVTRMTNLLAGKKVKEQEDVFLNEYFYMIKQRIARIAAGCKKCKVFDIANQFWFNGRFMVYDPKYLMSFFSKTLHLTPAGWTRVKPLLKHVCDSL